MSKTHGATKTPEFKAWQSMRQRCWNPSCPGYARYGGRGIAVCEEWSNDFVRFLADMGHRPSPRHTLDRINNDGHYEPQNCRWALPKTQTRNRSTNRLITFNGETKTATEWAESIGIRYAALERRLSYGWPLERALTTPWIPREMRGRPKNHRQA